MHAKHGITRRHGLGRPEHLTVAVKPREVAAAGEKHPERERSKHAIARTAAKFDSLVSQ